MNSKHAVIAPVLFALILCGSVQAQLRSPPKKAPETMTFRVTITNKSDLIVIFTMQWDGKAAEKVTLDPGKQTVAELTQPPAPQKPGLTVKFKPAEGKATVSNVLESGLIDPTTDNAGWIFDFVNVDSNLGSIIDLRKR
jgi:hypothetical protein